MTSFIQEYGTAIRWITIASAVMFVASLLVVPWIVIRIPSDYFAADRRPPSRFAFQHPALRLSVLVLRNLLAVMLLAAGLVMLVLPGQGLLTLAMGVVMLDLPGKHKLERWIIQRRPVRKSINWLRRKGGVAPLRLGTQTDHQSLAREDRAHLPSACSLDLDDEREEIRRAEKSRS